MAERYAESDKKREFWKGVAFLGAMVVGAELLL